MNIKNNIKDATLKVTSSFFKKIKEKLHELFLNTFVAKADEYYSYDKPSSEKMRDKIYWIQIIREETESC